MSANQNREDPQDQGKSGSWIERNRLLAGSLILVVGFAISVLIAYLMLPPAGIGIMGIGILLTVLIGGNVLSKGRDLSSAEVRRAIAISCTSVFFGLLAFGSTIKLGESVLQPILENFWWIIITIIGFYFGGRSAEKIVESISKKWTAS